MPLFISQKLQLPLGLLIGSYLFLQTCPKELGWTLFYGRILQWSWSALWAFIAVVSTFAMEGEMDYEILMEIMELRLQLWP